MENSVKENVSKCEPDALAVATYLIGWSASRGTGKTNTANALVIQKIKSVLISEIRDAGIE